MSALQCGALQGWPLRLEASTLELSVVEGVRRALMHLLLSALSQQCNVRRSGVRADIAALDFQNRVTGAQDLAHRGFETGTKDFL